MLHLYRQPLPASVAYRQQNDNRLYGVRTFQRPSRIPAEQHLLGAESPPGATRAAGGHLQGIPLIGRRLVVLGAVATGASALEQGVWLTAVAQETLPQALAWHTWP